MNEQVRREQRDGVMTLTLDRPDKRNALTGAMYTALEEGFRAAAADPAVRVVLVRGAGGSFTSGNDLQDFAQWLQGGDDLNQVPVVRLIRYLLEFDKPLVAAVEGHAVGFGTTLLLHCDRVYAAPSARFALPFVKLGLVPEFGSSLMLPALAGRVRASRWLLSGEAFDVEEAQALGIVSDAVPEGELEAAAGAGCRSLAALPPAALRATKALINGGERRERLRRAVDAELQAFAAGLQSAEHREAVQAFLEKRPPNFSKP